MQIPESLKSKRLRRGMLGSIEQDEFTDIIIELLKASGGKSRRQQVIEDIHRIFGRQFTEPDYELLESQKPPKERWIHNVDWAKRKLVAKGVICKPGKEHGVWILSKC